MDEEGGGVHFLCMSSVEEIKNEDCSTHFEIKKEDKTWDQEGNSYFDEEAEDQEITNFDFILDVDDDEDGENSSNCDTEEVDWSDLSSETITGRDKETVWNLSPQNDIKYVFFSERPGCPEWVRKCKTPLDAWGQLFTDDILHQIVESTNAYINSITKTDRSSQPTSIAEIKAVIGLTYIIATLKAAHMNTIWLWASDGMGIEILPCVMSQRRFIFLMRSLRFACPDSEEPSWPDPFGPFRPVFEQFVSNCLKSYVIHEKCDLDATLVGFRGECPFLRNMQQKMAQYGIKVYCLVDKESKYMFNMDVCLYGSKDDENPSDVVRKLCSPIMGTGRTVTFNHRFGSVALAEDLHEKGLNTVCALKKGSTEIPRMAVVKKMQEGSMRCYRIGELLCNSPVEDDRYVLYSTLPISYFGIESRDEIIRFYEDCKKGVALTVDSWTAVTSSRKSSRWPLTMFYFLLNVAGCNAQVIVDNNSRPSESIGHMEFLKHLGRALIHDQLIARSRMTTVPKMLHLKIKQFAGLQENAPWRSELAVEPPFKKLKRCEMCKRQADRKTKEWCIKCRIAVCKDHGVKVCQNCVANFLV